LANGEAQTMSHPASEGTRTLAKAAKVAKVRLSPTRAFATFAGLADPCSSFRLVVNLSPEKERSLSKASKGCFLLHQPTLDILDTLDGGLLPLRGARHLALGRTGLPAKPAKPAKVGPDTNTNFRNFSSFRRVACPLCGARPGGRTMPTAMTCCLCDGPV